MTEIEKQRAAVEAAKRKLNESFEKLNEWARSVAGTKPGT
jgi:hypothetical protein